MDNNLHLLETKVLEAVTLIKELRAENALLTKRCEEFSGRAAELEDESQRLKAELSDARANFGEVAEYEEKRKEIEDRVGGLLQKLEALG